MKKQQLLLVPILTIGLLLCSGCTSTRNLAATASTTQIGATKIHSGSKLIHWDHYYLASFSNVELGPSDMRSDFHGGRMLYTIDAGRQTLGLGYVGNWGKMFRHGGPIKGEVNLLPNRTYRVEGHAEEQSVTFIIRDELTGEIVGKYGPTKVWFSLSW